MPTFGDNMRTARVHARLAPFEVAQALGMETTTYNQYEGSVRPNPTLATMLSIAGVLRVTLSDLTDGVTAVAERAGSIYPEHLRGLDGRATRHRPAPPIPSPQAPAPEPEEDEPIDPEWWPDVP